MKRRPLELHHTADDKLRFWAGTTSKREIVEMAKAVFFSAETARGKMLAAYVIARFSPGNEVDSLEVEITTTLNELIETGELRPIFPDGYRKTQNAREREPGDTEWQDVSAVIDEEIEGGGSGFTIREIANAVENRIGPHAGRYPRIAALIRTRTKNGEIIIAEPGAGRRSAVYRKPTNSERLYGIGG